MQDREAYLGATDGWQIKEKTTESVYWSVLSTMISPSFSKSLHPKNMFKKKSIYFWILLMIKSITTTYITIVCPDEEYSSVAVDCYYRFSKNEWRKFMNGFLLQAGSTVKDFKRLNEYCTACPSCAVHLQRKAFFHRIPAHSCFNGAK